MLSKTKPADFSKRYDIVGCFMLCDDKFLLLHRHAHKASGDAWGLPAGKAEPGEDIAAAMLREIREETGITLDPPDLRFFGSFYVRHGTFDFEWHTFCTRLRAMPEVTINPHEHSEFKWVTQTEALHLSLVQDQDVNIEMFFSSGK